MNIYIKNYKNINELNYELIDGKFNYLFGISGSGKSSIPNAIVDENIEDNRMFGSPTEAEIRINGNVPQKDNFIIYNSETVTNYFSGDGNDLIYPIIIDNDSEYVKAQKSFIDFINTFERNLLLTKQRFLEISNMVRNLGASTLKKDNTLRPTSQLYKIVNSIDGMNNSRIYKEIEAMPDGKFDWILSGVDYLENNICPFCNKRISLKLSRKIEQFKSFDSKSLKSFKNEEMNYRNISGKQIQYTSSSVHMMMNSVIKMSIACKEYEKAQNYIFKLKELDDNINNITVLNVDNELYEFFPELKKPIKTLNGNITVLRNKYQIAKDKTANILKRKTRSINNIISKFGIPYEISVKYNQGRVNDYKLVHLKDSSKNDSRNKLSNGEKNIISLIFFALSVEKKENVTVIIDDPVSSYDECRRKIVLDFLISKLVGKTILLLSHDSVFAKYAALSKTNSGNIHYLDNYGDKSIFVPISKDDFGDFHDFVVARINRCTDYYVKVMNLRLLYEGKHSSIIYSYLSALLHATSVDEIELLINDKATSEDVILNEIKEKYNINLEKMHINYYKNVNTDNLSFFEKALFLREYMKNHDNINKKYKSELDGFIHLNSRLLISLDPYKYTICTPNVYHIVTENISGILNVKE